MSDQLNQTEEIGGILFFIQNIAVYLPYSTFMAVGSFFGMFGKIFRFQNELNIFKYHLYLKSKFDGNRKYSDE